jgi:hypothetical protein
MLDIHDNLRLVNYIYIDNSHYILKLYYCCCNHVCHISIAGVCSTVPVSLLFHYNFNNMYSVVHVSADKTSKSYGCTLYRGKHSK